MSLQSVLPSSVSSCCPGCLVLGLPGARCRGNVGGIRRGVWTLSLAAPLVGPWRPRDVVPGDPWSASGPDVRACLPPAPGCVWYVLADCLPAVEPSSSLSGSCWVVSRSLVWGCASSGGLLPCRPRFCMSRAIWFWPGLSFCVRPVRVLVNCVGGVLLCPSSAVLVLSSHCLLLALCAGVLSCWRLRSCVSSHRARPRASLVLGSGSRCDTL